MEEPPHREGEPAPGVPDPEARDEHEGPGAGRDARVDEVHDPVPVHDRTSCQNPR